MFVQKGIDNVYLLTGGEQGDDTVHRRYGLGSLTAIYRCLSMPGFISVGLKGFAEKHISRIYGEIAQPPSAKGLKPPGSSGGPGTIALCCYTLLQSRAKLHPDYVCFLTLLCC